MKSMKKITALFAFAAVMISLSGCNRQSEEMLIVDWSPVNIIIEATDSDGNSIISPEMPGMTLTYKGETYQVKKLHDRNEIQTKAYLAILFGLYAEPVSDSEGNTTYRLCFGEIDGAADMDEDIILNWPDGSEDTIHYHCANHRVSPKPQCDRSWKLNGEKHEGNIFRFTGKSLNK